MLSSSDAKWRCMWHMLIWSIMLTLVSQFLDLRDHVAFYLFGAITVLILPILTSIYSNTSGKHGKGLLRAGYVICDPVIGCVSVTPILLLRHLPRVVDGYYCFSHHTAWNESVDCINNRSEPKVVPQYFKVESPPFLQQEVVREKRLKFLVIQGAVVFPVLVSLMMWRRTHKMNSNTFLMSFVYWFITAIEAANLMEIALLGEAYKHMTFTTSAIISIAMIITNSYAVSTLCSYVVPMASAHKKEVGEKFDFVYKIFVGIAGVFFVETPFLVARFRALAADVAWILPGTFYIWLVKDLLFVFIIVGVIYNQKFGNRIFNRMRCRPSFDSIHVRFEPEKRDRYLVHKSEPFSPISQEPVENAETVLMSSPEQDVKPRIGSKKVSFSLGGDELVSHQNTGKTKKKKVPTATLR